MDKRMRYVGGWASTLIFLTMVSTALGDTTTVKPNHEPGTAEQAKDTATTQTAAGVIPTAASDAKKAEDTNKVRLFQVKALLGAAIAKKPDPEKTKVLAELSTPPKDAADAAQKQKLAKDLIQTVAKERLNDEEKKQLTDSLETLAGTGPATAEELRTAAKDLTDGNKQGDPALAAAKPALTAQNGGATTDPNKVAAKADAKVADPAADAKNDFAKRIADLEAKNADVNKKIQGLAGNNNDKGANTPNNADLAKALADQGKQDQNQNQGNQGSGSPSGGTPSGDSQNPSAKQDHNDTQTAKNQGNDTKKDQGPLFSNNSGNNSSGKDDKSKDDEKKSTAEPLFDMAKLKENATKKDEKKAADTKADKKGLDNLDASNFGNAPSVNPASRSDVPPGNSQLGQTISNPGGGGFDASQFGGGGGGEAAGPFGDGRIASGAGASAGGGGGGGGGEFPQGVGYDSSNPGGAPMKYNYTKGQDVYKAGGEGSGGGGNSGDGEVDGGNERPETPTVASAMSYAKKLAEVSSQILYAPTKNSNDISARPGPFGFTKIARTFLGTRLVKGLSARQSREAAATDNQVTLR